MATFDEYAFFIRDYIFSHNWHMLRGVQIAAADAIFHTDCHVLLTSATASGKTEAAFFPMLTALEKNPSSSVGILYIAPLKALINDQFTRLNELCEDAHIPVWHWHGDVSYSHKQKLMKHPSGILQITPESLEAFLMHRHSAVSAVFHDLRYIVIDEVHSLMRADRGAQCMCLIERLERLSGSRPRRIGLSATIGEKEKAAAYLASGSDRSVVVPTIEEKGTAFRVTMEHYFIEGAQCGENKHDIPCAVMPEEPTDIMPKGADLGYGTIFEHSRHKKCLIFVNSREECEAVTTSLRSYCEAKHEADRFLIHHGNLSASLREGAEQVMKDDERMLSTVTTATLELGIDIGRLERAFQIDAPATVSSFLQRMGRTGRRDLPPEMWFVIREETPEARAMLPESIPWKLLQAISLIELAVVDKFVEPPRLERLPFSLLYHQTMATLASEGEMTPAVLASKVLTLTPFSHISKDDYRVLLRHLIESGHIERTEEGGLIVGLAGERIVNNFKFYAVFVENEEYTVRTASEELGTIVKPPPVGDKIALAGHVWVVDEIDHKRHLIYCTKVRGKVPAFFGECAGDIHTRVLQKMREVLLGDKGFMYLQKNAVCRLQDARRMAKNADMAHNELIDLGGNRYAYFPWVGSYAFMTVERLLKIKLKDVLQITGIDSYKPYYIEFTMMASPEAFYEKMLEESTKDYDAMELIYPNEVPIFDKYDEFVPHELLRKGFAYGVLEKYTPITR